MRACHVVALALVVPFVACGDSGGSGSPDGADTADASDLAPDQSDTAPETAPEEVPDTAPDDTQPDTTEPDIAADTAETAETVIPAPAWDPDRVLPDTAAGRQMNWILSVLYEDAGIIDDADVAAHLAPSFIAAKPTDPKQRIKNLYGLWGKTVAQRVMTNESETFLTVEVLHHDITRELFTLTLDPTDEDVRIQYVRWWESDHLAPEFGPITEDELGLYYRIELTDRAIGAHVEVIDPVSGEPVGSSYETDVPDGFRGYTRIPLPPDHEGPVALRASKNRITSYSFSNLYLPGAELLSVGAAIDEIVDGAVFGKPVDESQVTVIVEVLSIASYGYYVTEDYFRNHADEVTSRHVGCARVESDDADAAINYYTPQGWNELALDTDPLQSVAIVTDLAPNKPHELTARVGDASVSISLPPMPPGSIGRAVLSFPLTATGTIPEPADCAQSFAE